MSVHSSAIVHADADIDETCEIGPNVVIESGVRLGPDCRLGPGAIVLSNVEIGAGCRIHAHAVIGDIPQDRKLAGENTYCRIGENCIIREGATVHRATIKDAATIVGNNCYLMTNSHVGHDCIVEDGVTLVSGALLGGHVHVGKGAVISGNCGIHQFVRIGELAMIGGVAMLNQDIPPFVTTNHQGQIAGLNSIGLARAGLTNAERHDVKALFKVIFRLGVTRMRAVELASGLASTEAGRRFVSFFQESSQRGIRKFAPATSVKKAA